MINIFSEDVAPYSFIGLVCNKELPSQRSKTIGLAINFTIAATAVLALMSATAGNQHDQEHNKYAAVERSALNS